MPCSNHVVIVSVDQLLAGDLGERLRLARKLRGLSQHKLAAKSGIPQATIHRAERSPSNSRLGTIESLASALEIPLALLFTEGTNQQFVEQLGYCQLAAAQPSDT